MTPKITRHEFFEFYNDFHTGAYPSQRLGQAFVNKFTRESEPCPDIFYEANEKEAIQLIKERYVIQEEKA